MSAQPCPRAALHRKLLREWPPVRASASRSRNMLQHVAHNDVSAAQWASTC